LWNGTGISIATTCALHIVSSSYPVIDQTTPQNAHVDVKIRPVQAGFDRDFAKARHTEIAFVSGASIKVGARAGTR
jgi:hypothetical protein